MEEKERKFWCRLGQVIGKSQLAKELTFLKFKNGFSPFKDAKRVSEVREILLASYFYISTDPTWYRTTWDWRVLWQLIDNNNKAEIKWLAMQCIRILCDVSDKEYFDWLKFHGNFTPEQLRKFRLDYHFIYNINRSSFNSKTEKIVKDLLAGYTVDIYGINIVKYSETLSCPNEKESRMIVVPSVRTNLLKVATALSDNRPVLIEGPLGSGKTSLIEYLSELTGRCKPPELTKIQIGNQVDGKLLVGTYCCSDVIGEFIWKPGPLTEALLKGHWLVFEDIDCASADVITILSSIIKSRSLNAIPGCYAPGSSVDPRFRLFFTRRITDGHTEAFSNTDKDMILKMCEKICIDNPSQEELEFIITKRWPNLIAIISRICEIYKIVVEDSFSINSSDSIGSSSNRKASLRDFLKWCRRIAVYFQQLVLNDSQREACLLDANDCFLANISNKNVRSLKSQAVGVQLNIAEKITEQRLLNRRPEISVKNDRITIGRASLPSLPQLDKLSGLEDAPPFSKTNSSLCLLEKIACSVAYNEPVLLVGETGTGKTSTVQYLCNLLNRQLTVINMNQQSDTCDLLGGYKPVKISYLMEQLRDEFDKLFSLTFNQQNNAKFLRGVASLFKQQSWEQFLDLLLVIQKRATEGNSKTLNNRSPEERVAILERWNTLGVRINKFKSSSKEVPLVFTYIEGTLVKAMRKGDWILLDEINLAESETLQCLSSILESDDVSVLLLDKADGEPIKKHPDFRLFACMNPSTDIGKRDLPLGIRNRFTEFYVEEIESEIDLRELVSTYLKKVFGGKRDIVGNIVKFYLEVRREAKKTLKDAAGGNPNFTLRTLCRALQVIVNTTWNESSSLRVIYEAFCLSFLTQLNSESYSKVNRMILETILKSKNVESITNMPLAKPKSKDNDYIIIDGYWIPKGKNEPLNDESYILTDSVKRNLHDIARIVSLGRSYPVLIQGETSVGKTSMINYLAKRSGNVCLRVNNHEHTDLQEYIGSYTADDEGKLVFKKGVLVEAMENGYWIILDELNLASTEVLEALNRVLDDNRELFIPETQEIIKAKKNFLLFATQNPPGHYGGRKILSRAFRNRFIELHFDEIPANELEIILQKRCLLPSSYAKKMVMTLTRLRSRLHQSVSLSFAGKHGGVTLRDLFRWGERYRLFNQDYPSSQRFYDWDQHLANEGYMLLAGRSRNQIEEQVIREELGKIFKIQNYNPEEVFEKLFSENFSNKLIPDNFQHLFWTPPLKRLAILVFQSLKYNEPVLLVGETGCGKTTICQLFASLKQKPLFSVNCHMHSESSDFLGSLRPVRQHADNDEIDTPIQRLFEWVDGPLVKAMQLGSVFLIDEISLADDSVLERLNSVIEPERLLLLTEKGFIGKDESNHSDLVIKAHDEFHLVATMNPGGDYGKKELSPALRNRFTEIWCYSSTKLHDIRQIISHNLVDLPVNLKENIVSSLSLFLEWFLSKTKDNGLHFTSIRDVLSLVNFVSTTLKPSNRKNSLNPVDAIYHAVHLVFLDSLGSSGSTIRESVESKKECEAKLMSILSTIFGIMENSTDTIKLERNKRSIGIPPFFIPRGNFKVSSSSSSSMYIFDSPTVVSNAQRLLRAMQLSKPILIEGVPGVGKTSLVQSLAKASNYQVIRINLSEQTDVSDLFGADLPVEGSEGKFSWRDGPLLQALKCDSCWVLLDELNLASQSVLEGLNACLDHRGEIFLPELGKTFSVSKQATRIFACQNPHAQGGDRKGLPKSFLNRFTVIHVEKLTPGDLKFIISNVYSTIPADIIDRMVAFNEKLIHEVNQSNNFGRRGYPWEFNLRDIFRWCQLILASSEQEITKDSVANSMKILYTRRFRSHEDIDILERLFESTFEFKLERSTTSLDIYPDLLQVGQSFLPRTANKTNGHNWLLLHQQLPILEALMKCVEMNWMALIVGSSQSGKSSLVHLLSQLVGANLKTISVNSEMDTIELLGGFSQKDVINDFERLETSIEPFIWNYVRLETINSNYSLAREALKEWFVYKTSNPCETANKCLKRLTKLQTLIEKVTTSDSRREDLLKKLKDLVDYIKSRNSLTSRGSFQWIDSVLVDALREGDWLLIDDTNLCPASVLDRLNGLLEPDGELVLNEQGCVDGTVPVVRPHPNFRLFLTIDPKNGELSRAMRNRGVEIFILPTFSESDIRCQMMKAGLTNYSFQEVLFSYYKKLLNSNIHLTDEQSNGSHLIQLASRIALELRCGADIKTICQYHPEIEQFTFLLDQKAKLPVNLTESTLINRDIKSRLGDILISNLKSEFSIVSSVLSDRDFQTSTFNNLQLIQIVSNLGLFALRASKEDCIYRSDLVCSKFGISFDMSVFNDLSKSVSFFRNQLPCSSSCSDYLPIDLRFNPTIWHKVSSNLNGLELADIQRNLNCRALKIFNWILGIIQRYLKMKSSSSLLSYSSNRSLTINHQIMKCIFPLMDYLQTQRDSSLSNMSVSDEELYDFRPVLLWIHQLICFISSDCITNDYENYIFENLLPLWVIVHDKLRTHPTFKIYFDSNVYKELNSHLRLDQKTPIEMFSLKKHLSPSLTLYKDNDSALIFVKSLELSRLLVTNGTHFALNHHYQRFLDEIVTVYSKMYRGEFDGLSDELGQVEAEMRKTKVSENSNQNDDMDERKDKELLLSFEKSASRMAQLVIPLNYLTFFWKEISYFKSLEPIRSVIQRLPSVCILPLHVMLIKCLASDVSLLKETFLFHLLDFQRTMTCNNLYSLLVPEDSSDLTREDSSEKSEWLKFGYHLPSSPGLTLLSSKLLQSPSVLGTIDCKTLSVEKLQTFIADNFEALVNFKTYNFSYRYVDLVLELVNSVKSTIDDFLLQLDPRFRLTFGKVCAQVSEESANLDNRTLGSTMILFGSILSHLWSPTMPIDPLQKWSIKLSHYLEERNFLDEELSAYNHFSILKSGESMISYSEHPHVSQALKRRSIVDKKIEKLEARQGHRPAPSQYQKLRHEVVHFLSTLLPLKRVFKLLEKLEHSEITGELINLQKSVSNFINNIRTNYPLYSNVSNEMLLGLSITVYGLNLSSHELLTRKTMNFYTSDLNGNIFNRLNPLFKFATLDPVSRALDSINLVSAGDFKHLSSLTKLGNITTSNLLYKSALAELLNAAKLNIIPNEEILITLFKVIDTLLLFWVREEDQRKEKKAEEDSLFHYKSKIHPDELPEEVIDEIEMKGQFPTYEHEFNQFIKDPVNPNQISDDCNINQHTSDNDTIQEHDIIEISKLHKDVLSALLRKTSTSTESIDIFKPLAYRFQVSTEIVDVIGPVLSRNLDPLSIECSWAMTLLFERTLSLSAVTPLSTRFNFYKDSNPSELRECYKVLEPMKNRILEELLPQFPGNPKLHRILLIIERLYVLDINSPLSKVVTGLEVLLRSAEDWEQMAHKKIKLSEQLAQVTSLVLKWRKMELKFWSTLLDSVHNEIERKQVCQYWFHFYSLIHSILTTEEDDDQEKSEETGQQLLVLLRRFFEESTIGQFNPRLQLLKNFIDHQLCLDSRRSQLPLFTILINIHHFYTQFKSTISDEIIKIRNPIEKELKEFVKIMRWNDGNFWSLKSNVEKSHKTLHRLTKKYNKSLIVPSKTFFKLSKVDASNIKFPSLQSQSSDTVFIPLNPINCLKLKLLPRSHQLVTKVSKYSKKTKILTKYLRNSIKNMDSRIGDIIEGINEMANLKVPTGIKEKEKYEKEVKSINNVKRQAFSSLLKNLGEWGISFKKGVEMYNSFDLETVLASCYPFESSWGLAITKDQSDSIDKYFYSVLSRYTDFKSALTSPCDDLKGIRNVFERLKGTVGFMLNEIVSSKSKLFEQLYSLQKLKQISEIISKCSVGDGNKLSSPYSFDHWMLTFSKHNVALQCLLRQIKELPIKSNPTDSEHECSSFELCLTNLNTISSAFSISSITSYKSLIVPASSNDQLENAWKQLAKISSELKSHLESIEPVTGTVVDHLVVLCEQISQDFISFQARYHSDDHQTIDVKSDTIYKESECFLVSILSQIQRLFHNLQAIQPKETNEAPMSKVYSQISKNILNELNLTRVPCEVEKILHLISNSMITQNQELIVIFQDIVSHINQYLNNYVDLLTYITHLNLSSLRTRCKLLYILLGLFTDVCQKGFCLPPPWQDENDKTVNKDKLKDLTDAGLGDGDGEEDVSNKIESEDQLDETLPSGAQKEEDKSDDKDIKDEKDGIEMSEDFDAPDFGPDEKDKDEDKSDSDNDEDEDDLDKKMGDIDDTEGLDDKMWGDDEEDSDEEEEDEDEDNLEDGGDDGGEEMGEDRLVAKDDNQGVRDKSKGNDKNKDEDDEDESKNEEINEQKVDDEYEGERQDPFKQKAVGEEDQECKDAEEFPEDMELDANEAESENDDNGEEGEGEEDQDQEEGIQPESFPEDVEDQSDEANKADEEKVLEEVQNDETKEDSEQKEEQNEEKDGEKKKDQSTPDNQVVETQDAPLDSGVDSELKSNAQVDPCFQQDEQNTTEGASEIDVNKEENDGTGNSSNPHEGQSNEGKIKSSAIHDESENQQSSTSKPHQKKRGLKSTSEAPSKATKKQRILERYESELPEPESFRNNDQNKKEIDSSMVQHCAEDETSSKEVIDIAEDTDAVKSRPENMDQEKLDESEIEREDFIGPEEMEVDESKEDPVQKKKPEKSVGDKQGSKNDENTPEGEGDEEMIELGGDFKETSTVPRGLESQFYSQFSKIEDNDRSSWFDRLHEKIEKNEFMVDEARKDAWNQCEKTVGPLVYELCQQLQLVLEPMKAAKMKGDYRTGKRLNMRKVIEYIASSYKKDKIWLRRTKPSKRQYQIVLAIDDSSSMLDNDSKRMAFESIALLGKSLSLIEAGELAIMSFGEQVNLLHTFDEPFTDLAGSKLLSQLNFEQKRTRVVPLLNSVTTYMLQCSSRKSAQGCAVSQLLIIISDGRGLEDRAMVRQAIRNIQELRVFTVFLVMDSLSNKDSILDITRPIYEKESDKVTFESYMDNFPFPFYIILKDINSMPKILGEALRKWLELVTQS